MSGTSCQIAVKAIPDAPQNEVVGWLGEALKVKVHAPALEGKANEALCVFIAVSLGLPKRAVTLAYGETSRQKRLRIEGLSFEQVRIKLGV
jgi:hypothetical protein